MKPPTGPPQTEVASWRPNSRSLGAHVRHPGQKSDTPSRDTPRAPAGGGSAHSERTPRGPQQVADANIPHCRQSQSYRQAHQSYRLRQATLTVLATPIISPQSHTSRIQNTLRWHILQLAPYAHTTLRLLSLHSRSLWKKTLSCTLRTNYAISPIAPDASAPGRRHLLEQAPQLTLPDGPSCPKRSRLLSAPDSQLPQATRTA